MKAFQDDYTVPILTTSPIHFSLEGWENVLFEIGSKRVNTNNNNFQMWINTYEREILLLIKKMGRGHRNSQANYCGPRLWSRTRIQNNQGSRSALSFYSAPCRFSSAPCCFFSALSFSESPLVSLGFHQRYFELEVAESFQLRRKVARFLCITLLFASDIAAILDLRWILIYAN